MKKYYVNKHAQSNGDHEVHNEDCSFLPHAENRMYLGIFYACASAVTEAKKLIRKPMAVRFVHQAAIPGNAKLNPWGR
jgi:hypothetical protein